MVPLQKEKGSEKIFNSSTCCNYIAAIAIVFFSSNVTPRVNSTSPGEFCGYCLPGFWIMQEVTYLNNETLSFSMYLSLKINYSGMGGCGDMLG